MLSPENAWNIGCGGIDPRSVCGDHSVSHGVAVGKLRKFDARANPWWRRETNCFAHHDGEQSKLRREADSRRRVAEYLSGREKRSCPNKSVAKN